MLIYLTNLIEHFFIRLTYQLFFKNGVQLSWFIIAKFLNRQLLFVLDFGQTLVLECKPLKHHFLFVNNCFELLLLFPSVVFLALDLVSGSDGLQFSIFNFLGLLLKDICQGGHHFVERHYFWKSLRDKNKYLLLRKSMHSVFRFSVSLYLSEERTLIWLFSSNVILTSIFPGSITYFELLI